MFTIMRRSWLLFALCALVALSSAFNLESLSMDGIESYLHKGQRRQAGGTGSTSTPTPTPSSEPSQAPSSTPPPPESSVPPPESSAPPPESSAPPAESSTPPPASSAPPSSTPPPSSAPPSSTPPTSSRITAPITRSTPLVSTETQQFTTTFVTFVDGQSRTQVSVGTRTNLHTTGSHFETELPSTQDAGNSSGGGLSTEKKSIIGGVVGGVGGALLLGGLALVAWRIWGRKKRVSEDDDDMTFSTGSALGDKSSPPPSANTPFQSNLEQYHNPGGRPNAAANF